MNLMHTMLCNPSRCNTSVLVHKGVITRIVEQLRLSTPSALVSLDPRHVLPRDLHAFALTVFPSDRNDRFHVEARCWFILIWCTIDRRFASFMMKGVSADKQEAFVAFIEQMGKVWSKGEGINLSTLPWHFDSDMDHAYIEAQHVNISLLLSRSRAFYLML